MKILFGIWNGQFGYELLHYQPFVRRMVKKDFPKDEIFVASTHPSAVLYGDFAKHIYIPFAGSNKEGYYCDDFKYDVKEIIEKYGIDKHIPIGFEWDRWRLGHHNNYENAHLDLGDYVVPDVDGNIVPVEVLNFISKTYSDIKDFIVITPRTRKTNAGVGQLNKELTYSIIDKIRDRYNVIINGLTPEQYGKGNAIIDEYEESGNVLFLPKYYDGEYVNTQCYVLQECKYHITTASASMILGFFNKAESLVLCNKVDSTQIESHFERKYNRFKVKAKYPVSESFTAEDVLKHLENMGAK